MQVKKPFVSSNGSCLVPSVERMHVEGEVALEEDLTVAGDATFEGDLEIEIDCEDRFVDSLPESPPTPSPTPDPSASHMFSVDIIQVK